MENKRLPYNTIIVNSTKRSETSEKCINTYKSILVFDMLYDENKNNNKLVNIPVVKYKCNILLCHFKF